MTEILNKIAELKSENENLNWIFSEVSMPNETFEQHKANEAEIKNLGWLTIHPDYI